MPTTFEVSDVIFDHQKSRNSIRETDISSWVENSKMQQEHHGRVLKTTTPDGRPISGRFQHGFVNACITAYNLHCHLTLKPDDVWMAITTALARYINANSDMRQYFVEHEDKKELEVFGGGNIMSTNYDKLIDDLSVLIDENTVSDVKGWIECDFSTTTRKSKIVSKLVLMGAMKKYFSYKKRLRCGLPRVTLEGVVEDWIEIRDRVNRLGDWGNELGQWGTHLSSVLDNFVTAFENPSNVDKDWWNRITHISGGGSGPRYLEGWINVFVGWDDSGRYIPQGNGKYGKINTNDVPGSMIEVPVTIDDNGRIYDTIFYCGTSLATCDMDPTNPNIGVSQDWILIDITK